MTVALLRLLTWPYCKRHLLGQFLVVLGIALAVGVYASMHLAKNTIKEAFSAAAETLAGSAQLQVSGSEAGVPEEVLDRTRQVACVEAATGVILRTVATGLPNEGGMAILGVDLLEEPRFREYRIEGGGNSGPDDTLIFFAQPDSVLVTREFARRNRLQVGTPLVVWTGRAESTLKVRGMLEGAGVAGAHGGNIAVMDLYAAQQMFGRPGYFDRVDVAVRKDGDVRSCRDGLAASLGSHLKVEAPPSRGRDVEALSTTYLFLVESSGLLGMLLAMFLVHHAAASAVARREREIGIVLGLGGDEGSIRRVVLLESVALGALGGAAGIGVGVLAATGLNPALARLLEYAFGIHLAVGGAHIDWIWAAATVAVVILCCGASGSASARNAAAIPPIQLMQARHYAPLVERQSMKPRLVAAICAAAAVLWQTIDRRPEVLYVALPLVVLFLTLAGRDRSQLALRILRRPFAAVWPMEGALAIDGLARTNRRTRGTVLGVSATVATFLAISGITAAYADSFRLWTRQLVNADFLIHSSANPAARGKMFPLSMRGRLEKVPGVAAVVPVRRLTAQVNGRPARVIGIDFAAWKEHGGAKIPNSPDGAIVSDNFASLRGLRTGDAVRIAAPDGSFDVPIRAVIDDFTDELGTVWLDWQVYRLRFHDDAVEIFAVRLKPGASRALARQGLLNQFDHSAPVLILDGAEFRTYLDHLVDQWRAISYIQIIAAVLISLVGVGSFLVVSIVERRRELGLLVVLGATPMQLRRCVQVEALGVAAAGLLLGIPGGLLLQAYLLYTFRRSLNGYALPWTVDGRLAVALLLAVPLAAWLAATLPLRSLNRMNLAREVETDA
jgi:putative ABC transport system permease protein